MIETGHAHENRSFVTPADPWAIVIPAKEAKVVLADLASVDEICDLEGMGDDEANAIKHFLLVRACHRYS